MREELIENVVKDKLRGMSDKEIGDKYGITLRKIEKAVTKKLGVNVSTPVVKKEIKRYAPKDFKLETNTVWSFKSRGNWATHNGNYRGNWSPYIPRNVILRYSQENDLVLDFFCGAGTTAIESKLLNRNFIGFDINPQAIELAKNNLNFGGILIDEPIIDLHTGDARDLNGIQDESIDLICSHPPYADIIQYTDNNPNDLSYLSLESFLSEMEKVAQESYRVLKPGKYCAILIGDMRKKKNVVPLGFKTLDIFLKAGFQLQDLIIKRQHNCKTTGFWYNNSIKFNFLLLAHEYLAIFCKTNEPTLFIDNDLKDNNVLYNNYLELNDIVLESTTVWIFHLSDWKERVINNLVRRYSKKKTILFDGENNTNSADLVITSDEQIIVKGYNFVDKLSSGTTLAIVCQDIRTSECYIYSPAFEIYHMLQNLSCLTIKEIVVVAIENTNEELGEKRLNINHKYVLIYRKV